MREKGLLILLNDLIEKKKLPFKKLESWDVVSSLNDEDLHRMFDTLVELLLTEGLDSEDEPNKLGLIYEDINEVLNEEIIRRNDSK